MLIATTSPRVLFLFFSGAASVTDAAGTAWYYTLVQAHNWASRRAAEKQKEQSRFMSRPLNMAPLTGFEALF
jgi:hypothetical protein